MVGSLSGRVLDLAFPARCPGCGREGAPICDACLPALDARLDRPAGIPIGLPSDIPPPILQLEWCAPFSGVVRRALHELKYAGETRLARPLGAAVARRWARVGAGGDVLVPVPVHAERRQRRGYDQAELIARVAAADLGLPCAPILERARATVAQFDLDRATRATNVRGAFALRPPPGEIDPGRDPAHDPGRDPADTRPADTRPADTRPLAGRWVVLVDDVVTTGATLSACAEPLLRAGAFGVSAITVARER
jgi:predicted amidophosphoribosyltransferase